MYQPRQNQFYSVYFYLDTEDVNRILAISFTIKTNKEEYQKNRTLSFLFRKFLKTFQEIYTAQKTDNIDGMGFFPDTKDNHPFLLVGTKDKRNYPLYLVTANERVKLFQQSFLKNAENSIYNARICCYQPSRFHAILSVAFHESAVGNDKGYFEFPASIGINHETTYLPIPPR